ncbi:hypothetical protein [Thermococcus sp.]|uniref:hypothetical protein n=1 Tax=Thermococcus sp. TaxID=35749 RepID=UPI0026228A95|nr:hypothetical protein [Thermococcus sp.]
MSEMGITPKRKAQFTFTSSITVREVHRRMKRILDTVENDPHDILREIREFRFITTDNGGVV